MLVPDMFRRNVFDDFFDFPTMPRQQQAISVMKTDVREHENGYELDVDLPGIKKENVKVKLEDGYLTISASTAQNDDEKDKKGNYIRRERFSGSYSRSFYVGEEVKETDIKAKFDNGVLQLSIPKPEVLPKQPESKYIAIE
ncbi:MAG TPA: Hsp20/alpha crystallin family protein [Ruminococcaceae bacterium]|nr:Hsp20/alpha crystallin family protein [Oscillospiraceae bacterium]